MEKRPIVYGTTHSTYVRTVRLTLEEKRIPYDLVEVDVFAPGGPTPDYLTIHPFGRIPTLDHGSFRLYEAVAIARYVDEVFEGPPLQPKEILDRARMNQILSILDSYAYRTMVWDIYVERAGNTFTGCIPDEAKIAAALPRARICLNALSPLMGHGPWLAGPSLTLADLHAVPIFDYFLRTTEGRNLIASAPPLEKWWDQISERASIRATTPN